MDSDNRRGSGRGHEGGPGMIRKAAQMAAQEVTETDLAAINKLALVAVKAEDVFTFKVALCDNEVDRDFERFSIKALRGMQKLFLGKTGIKDHTWKSDNQVARIYATELIQDEKAVTKAGEPYTRLVAYCYMIKTAGNADLIAEIKGGIKKEVSIGCSMGSCICGICGTDNAKRYCGHFRGRSYEKDGKGMETCTFVLDDPKDAYEFSFVAVPAQRDAGACKSYTGETVYEPKEGQEPPETGNPETNPTDSEKAAALALRARRAAFIAKMNTYE